MISCPNCGSKDYYNHDKGMNYFIRIVTFNSRLVCRQCRTTWKRRTPEKFAKLKKRSMSRSGKLRDGYHIIPASERILKCDPDGINIIISEWQEESHVHICLDLAEIETLESTELNNLMNFYRRLKVLGGDMVVVNGAKGIMDTLWSLNLGHLIATEEKVKV